LEAENFGLHAGPMFTSEPQQWSKLAREYICRWAHSCVWHYCLSIWRVNRQHHFCGPRPRQCRPERNRIQLRPSCAPPPTLTHACWRFGPTMDQLDSAWELGWSSLPGTYLLRSTRCLPASALQPPSACRVLSLPSIRPRLLPNPFAPQPCNIPSSR
jgi:hypothetical protein